MSKFRVLYDTVQCADLLVLTSKQQVLIQSRIDTIEKISRENVVLKIEVQSLIARVETLEQHLCSKYLEI